MQSDQSFILGFFLGAILLMMGLALSEPDWVQKAYRDKRICEEVIPRNETCVIIALPKSKD